MGLFKKGRSGSAILIFLFLSLTSRALCQNSFRVPDGTIPAAASGVSFFLHAAHEDDLASFQISVRYSPGDLVVTDVTTSGTSVDSLPEPPDFWGGSVDTATGQIAYGAIFDFNLVHFLRPSGDRTLVRFEADVLALAGVVASVELENDPFAIPPASNLLVTQAARTIAPEVQSGSLLVVVPPGYVPLVVDAGPDATAPEDSIVTLDGSGSESPQGRPLAYRWDQITQPLANALTEPTVPQPQYSLPSVDGDAELIFELFANDGVTAATDRVTVTVLDLDQRQGSVGTDPPSPAVVIDGSRAMLFAGVVGWESPVEDGEWSAVTFTGSGDGDESSLLTSASLYLDSNDDGSFDESDQQIGETASIPGDNGRVTFNFSELIQASTSRRFFLVVDLATPQSQSSAWLLLAVLIVTGWFASRVTRPPKEARSWITVALLVTLPCVFLACSSGGGGGSSGVTASTAPSREVRFDIANAADLDVHGIISGVAAPTDGTPLRGPALEI